MTYNKPELFKLDSSIKAIQSQGMKVSVQPDSPFLTPSNIVATAGAYEADE